MRTLFLAAVLTSACSPREGGPAALPPGDYRPRPEDDELPLPRERAAALRNDAFVRARVWHEPAVPVAEADFRANPPGEDSFPPSAELVCKFVPKSSRGQTPKFHCVLPRFVLYCTLYGTPAELFHRNCNTFGLPEAEMAIRGRTIPPPTAVSGLNAPWLAL